MAAPRSNRPRSRRFDDADWQPDEQFDDNLHDSTPLYRSDDVGPQPDADPDPDPHDEPCWSTYRDAAKGPDPVPDWVLRDPRAVDHDLGVMKTGKEAEVSLLRRGLVPDGPFSLMAVKRYRSAQHRLRSESVV